MTAVAAVLLEHTGACRLKPRRKLIAEFPDSSIEMSVGAPTKMLRAVKDLLHPHFENDVGMGADPDALRSDFSQHPIEHNSVLPLGNRIDPNEHAINFEK